MRYGFPIVVLLGSLLVVSAGCKKEPDTSNVQLPAELLSLRAETEKGKALLDKTVASLEAIIAAAIADSDPRPAYEAYKKDLAELVTQTAAVRSRADAMKAKGTAYFAAWNEKLGAIATPEIKAAAEKRRAEIDADYAAITENMAKCREEYDGILSTLQDFGKILENDLNTEGLKALKPKVEPFKAEVKKLQADLDGVLGSLNKIAAIYSPGA